MRRGDAGLPADRRLRPVLGDECGAVHGAKPLCHAPSGNCVACLADGDCPPRRPSATPRATPAGLRGRQRVRRGDAGLPAVRRLRPVLGEQRRPLHGRDAVLPHHPGDLRRLPRRRAVRRHDAGVRRQRRTPVAPAPPTASAAARRRPASRAARAASAPPRTRRAAAARRPPATSRGRLRRLHLERAVRGATPVCDLGTTPAGPAPATANAGARRPPASRTAPAASARRRTAPAAPARCRSATRRSASASSASTTPSAPAPGRCAIRSCAAAGLAAPTTSAAACRPLASRPAGAASARRRTRPAAAAPRRCARRSPAPASAACRTASAAGRSRCATARAIVPRLRVGRRVRPAAPICLPDRRLRALHGDRRLALPRLRAALRRLVGRRRLRRLPHRQPVRRRHAGLLDRDPHLRRLHDRRRAELPGSGAARLPALGPAARRLHRVHRDERHAVRRREAGLRRRPRRLRLRGADRRSLLRRRRLGPDLQRRGRVLRARLRPGPAQRLPDRPELPRRHERRRPVLGRDVPHATRTAAQPLAHCDLSGGPTGAACSASSTPTATRPWSATRPRRSASSASRAATDQCRPSWRGPVPRGRPLRLPCRRRMRRCQSGRVCDATASRCVPGCRGTGGNGCPNEKVCSSTTDEMGRCDARPTTDGGVDGGSDGARRRRRGRRRGRCARGRRRGRGRANGRRPTARGRRGHATDARRPTPATPADGGDGGDHTRAAIASSRAAAATAPPRRRRRLALDRGAGGAVGDGHQRGAAPASAPTGALTLTLSQGEERSRGALTLTLSQRERGAEQRGPHPNPLPKGEGSGRQS